MTEPYVDLASLTEYDVAQWLTKASYANGYPCDYDPDYYESFDYAAIAALPFWKGIDTPIGSVREVDSYGGEGQGEQYWVIISVTQGDVVRSFKLDGWYASYDGGYYDEFYEVKPELKTITVWEKA